MEILVHHIYELQKGLRNLVLHTMPASLLLLAKEKLEVHGMPYIIKNVSPDKINIIFGARECVEVVASFGNKDLTELTPEEDFILGIMLGYCRIQQCRRFIKRKNSKTNVHIHYPKSNELRLQPHPIADSSVIY
ncbi:MAG: DUF2023 family protein [Candidatus Zixiibacteriota bacterium]